jgi:hypothetical protein
MLALENLVSIEGDRWMILLIRAATSFDLSSQKGASSTLSLSGLNGKTPLGRC